MHPFADDFPTTLLRRYYVDNELGTIPKDLEYAASLVFRPFQDTLADAYKGNLPVDVAWPCNPHWLPRGWEHAVERIASEYNPEWSFKTRIAVAKNALVRESPCLATVSARINTAYKIFAQYETMTKWHQQLRMFMDTHCAFVYFAHTVSCEGHLTDATLQQKCVFDATDPLWEEIEPNSNRIISERLTPDCVPLIFMMNICFKRQLTKARTSRIGEILGKALPQIGAIRMLYSMIEDRCEDEVFYRFVVHIVFCSLMGTYRTSASSPYDMETQALIWNTFCNATRGTLVEFVSHELSENLFIYAGRQYIDYLAQQTPAFSATLNRNYNWKVHREETRYVMRAVRAYCTEIRAFFEEYNSHVDLCAKFWTNIDNFLDLHHANHSNDTRIKKLSVTGIDPCFSTLATNVKKLGVLVPRRPKKGKKVLPFHPVQFDIKEISKYAWERACKVTSRRRIEESITLEAIKEMGLTPRGFNVVCMISRVFNEGDILDFEYLAAIPPGDLDLFHAYILASKQQTMVSISFHHPRIARAQLKAIRRRLSIPDYLPLPNNLTRVFFCEKCLSFRHVQAKNRVQTMCNGPDKHLVHELYSGRVMCAKKKNHSAPCRSLLHSIQMVGKVVHTKRQCFSLCCGCGLASLYDPTTVAHGYPVCGKCDAEHLGQPDKDPIFDKRQTIVRKRAKYMAQRKFTKRVARTQGSQNSQRQSSRH